VTEERGTPSLGWGLVAGMMLAAALAPLGSTMIAVALPGIGEDLGSTQADLTQWLVASYLITSIALQSPGGRLGDRISHRRALLLGLGLVATGATLGFAVATLPALVAARVLTAAGGAATVPAVMAILRNHVAPERRARAFGFFGACMGLAAAAGPLVGGELTTRFGWRAVFAANLPVVAVSLALVLRNARVLAHDAPAAPHPRFDVLGSALLAVGISLPVLALRMNTPMAPWLAAAGALLLIAFPFVERRHPAPVVDLDLLRNRAFLAGGLVVAFQNLAMYALLFQLPIFFSTVRGENAHDMGRALTALTLTMVVTSLAGGRLSEALGARAQVLIGSLMALGGMYWFHDWTGLATPSDAVPGLVLMGAGIGLSSAPSQAAAMAGSTRANSGMAAGLLSTMRYLGGVVGIALLGALMTDPADPRSHATPVIAYGAALACAALLAGWLPRSTRKAAPVATLEGGVPGPGTAPPARAGSAE
jgi:MFS family permease